jgi:clan AA aspartic protease (TIGR02281 family)
MNHLAFSLAPLPLLLLVLPAAAQGPGFQARLDAVEAVLERFYRGESLEAGHRRVNALVEDYNAQIRQRNSESDAARGEADRALRPSEATASRLEALDQALGPAPAPLNRDAMRRYNDQVDRRNALVGQYNAQLAEARQSLEAYQERMRRMDDAMAALHGRLQAQQQALQARQAAFDAFSAQERDVAFFTGLNSLLADLRAAVRKRPDPALEAALARARAQRRELAKWAAARQEAQDNGLVLVEALVGDEPCTFIVDTGAQLLCLPREIVDALGLTGALGEEATLILAGGLKMRGRSLELPRVAVGGLAATGVAGSAIPPSEVGIDGLLGQSFLKRFRYTIDEGRPEKLLLTPR